jgi:hypothetical protein
VSKLQIALGLVLAVFGFETAWFVTHQGFAGFMALFDSVAGRLAFFDLTIALSLVMVWMWRDAGERNATVVPYLLLTVAFGSVGPLLYLIVREGRKRSSAVPGEKRAAQLA